MVRGAWLIMPRAGNGRAACLDLMHFNFHNRAEALYISTDTNGFAALGSVVFG